MYFYYTLQYTKLIKFQVFDNILTVNKTGKKILKDMHNEASGFVIQLTFHGYQHTLTSQKKLN